MSAWDFIDRHWAWSVEVDAGTQTPARMRRWACGSLRVYAATRVEAARLLGPRAEAVVELALADEPVVVVEHARGGTGGGR